MGKLIQLYSDGSFLEYDTGTFDDWCVYLTRPNQARYAPKDYQYFERFIKYGEAFGNQLIYDDFVSVYDRTTKELYNSVFKHIHTLSEKYGQYAQNIEIDLGIVYMGMIAEENKAFTKLGKRVKRLGMYQILFENLTPHQAANFSKGKKWREIDELCKKGGF